MDVNMIDGERDARARAGGAQRSRPAILGLRDRASDESPFGRLVIAEERVDSALAGAAMNDSGSGPEQDGSTDVFRLPRSLRPVMFEDLEPGQWPVDRRRSARLPWSLYGAAAAAVCIALVVALVVVRAFPWPSRGAASVGDDARATLAPGSHASSDMARPAAAALPPVPPQLALLATRSGEPDEALPLGIRAIRASTETASTETVVVIGIPTGATLTPGRRFDADQWRLDAADLAAAMLRPPQGFLGRMDLIVELRLSDDVVADRQPLTLTWLAPEARVGTANPSGIDSRDASPSAAAAPRAATASVAKAANDDPVLHIEPTELIELLARGDSFVQSGKITEARLLFERATRAHSAQGALKLGATYDPIFLERLGVHGLAPDAATARVWYQRAQEFGSDEAPQRLEMLASRSR
jgi:hypothetical protein